MKNRVIKFRFWDGRRRTMVSEAYTYFVGMEGVVESLWGGGFGPAEGVVPLQFTGLLDADGKEVNEGDVFEAAGLSSRGGEMLRYVVKWDDVIGKDGIKLFSSFSMYHADGTKWDSLALFQLEAREKDTFRVLGNRYENPELLEEAAP